MTNKMLHTKCIYLDFEGEGKKKDKGSPPPIMVGVFRPIEGFNKGGSYESFIFKSNLRPLLNGIKSTEKILKLSDFIEELLDEAEKTNTKIVYWSDYEKAVIAEQYPSLLGRFEKVSLNLLPLARKFKNRKRLILNEKEPKVLIQYLLAIKPKTLVLPKLKIGAAESCRRLERYSSKRWGLWTDIQKQTAWDFFRYNENDCRSMFKIAKTLMNSPILKRDLGEIFKL